jgi:hypothetical protein
VTDAPDWLATLQQHFGDMLRTPLDRSRGSLHAQTQAYARALCDAVEDGVHTGARERLAIYHRQYWFRLFGVLQREYRLTARLLGMWQFNELAARYLRAHPPSAHDLQHIAHAFPAFLARHLPASGHAGVRGDVLGEAAQLDATFSRVFLAPEVRLLAPAQLAGPELPARQLRLAHSVALFREHWPLVALRRTLMHDTSESAVAVPARLASPGHWVIFRVDDGHQLAEIDARAYRLFTLLCELPVGEALARLESECDPGERPALPQRVQHWLRESMRVGFWLAD